ncbi:uncharacterized protein LOC127095257 [Lathyrus oleraceus]|uniref:uncharacterized protein LOC127095257 n=1 Tax=Pisum sativum TaxID=3888 RepID=UPI0021D24ABF|nr:uncharacterized protein LOC127095257 [Pisum sativum]
MKSASNNKQILHKISTRVVLTLEQQLVREGMMNGGRIEFSSNVTTSLAKTDHPIETSLEKSDGKFDSEFVPIKSFERSEEKDDSDSMSDKEENYGVKKDQSTNIINVDGMDSNDEPIGKRLPPKAPKKSTSVGSATEWIKVKTVGKKVHANVLDVPIDNISFHYVENVEKWKFVYQRRLDLERELGKDALECKGVVSLIENVVLMKNVAVFGKCYEILVKELIVNISKDYDNKRSKEFRKVYVIGKCVDFFPEIINRFMGRSEEEQVEVEVSDNIAYKEITAKQVPQ